MKFVVAFVALCAVASAVPLKQSNVDPASRQFFLMPDESGRLHMINTKNVPKFVDPIDTYNITFHVYSPSNKDEALVLHPHEMDKLTESPNYDPSLPNLFTTHGWTGTFESGSVEGVKNAILERHDVNVFCVDWSGPSHTFYTQARMYVNPLGDMIADFINEMMDHYNLQASDFHLMGHSLGGQLVGRIGYSVNGNVATIVSLDPAFPMFPYDDNLPERLDSTDAEFLQVIHTNSGFLGYPHSIGHADFHPNGGVKQTGCGPDLIGTCSHFLIKDIISETYGYVFAGSRCDSYEDYTAGKCSENAQSWFGGWPVDTSASGDYYLETNGEPPFLPL